MALQDIFTLDNYSFISLLVFKLVWVQNVVCYAGGRGKLSVLERLVLKEMFTFRREVVGGTEKTSD